MVVDAVAFLYRIRVQWFVEMVYELSFFTCRSGCPTSTRWQPAPSQHFCCVTMPCSAGKDSSPKPDVQVASSAADLGQHFKSHLFTRGIHWNCLLLPFISLENCFSFLILLRV